MQRPKAAQQLKRGLRQRHQAIFVAFGIANMHTLALRIDIPNLQAQAFTQAQSQAIGMLASHAPEQWLLMFRNMQEQHYVRVAP